MFKKEVYIQRRIELKQSVKGGLILLPGNHEISIDEKNSCLPFRQEDVFLYYTGIVRPDLVFIIDLDENTENLYGDDLSVEGQVWSGSAPKIAELAAQSGITNSQDLSSLRNKMSLALAQGRKIHFLPQYRYHNLVTLAELTGISYSHLNDYASRNLIQTVVKQRSVKSDFEIMEIEAALDITFEMHALLRNEAKPGLYERDLLGKLENIVTKHGSYMAYPPILTVKGQYLHNGYYGNQLKEGDLLLADVAAVSKECYCSDITRTFPVSGKFSSVQREIYDIVLNTQLKVIEAIKPGIPYKAIHLKAARFITEGLKSIGLMKGNVDDAVENGAHALFFPHGIGHMLGLAAHDMEGWGKEYGDYVGYDDKIKRSTQFGTAYLRMARELQPNFVVTVEPGIYFIPELIALWKAQNKLAEFINYDKLEPYKNSNIRIEDDILVTQDGHRILGKPIPKIF